MQRVWFAGIPDFQLSQSSQRLTGLVQITPKMGDDEPRGEWDSSLKQVVKDYMRSTEMLTQELILDLIEQ